VEYKNRRFPQQKKQRGDVLNKNDLIAVVATASGLSRSDAGNAVESVFGCIASELQKGGEVRIVNFGTFLVSQRKASEGRNPRTGEVIQIPATKQPKFKAGKALKDSLN
jgi:DNA-binding protein HU-beta